MELLGLPINTTVISARFLSQRQAHVLWLYFFIPPAPARIGRKTLTYSSGGSSREGLDLGGSFGRFLMARRFGRKLQTPFIGFGKGQGQLLSSRLRVLFKKPSPRYRVACAADTDSDVHCGSDVHLLRFVPAHCTGEHFAILGRHGVFGRQLHEAVF